MSLGVYLTNRITEGNLGGSAVERPGLRLPTLEHDTLRQPDRDQYAVAARIDAEGVPQDERFGSAIRTERRVVPMTVDERLGSSIFGLKASRSPDQGTSILCRKTVSP